MVLVYIALGSNVGNRECHLQQAVDKVKTSLTIVQASGVYETAPMYVQGQPPFLNAAIQANTSLSPLELLRLLKHTEKEVGRQERARYGPREVDLDLVAYGRLQYRYIAEGRIVLELPHPRTDERRFVLQPLYDLDPKLSLPGLGIVENLLPQTAGQASEIRRVDAVLSI